jgi:hypothetical protein
MADTVGHPSTGSGLGHTGAVDARLARIHGGPASTWHSRRFGRTLGPASFASGGRRGTW